MDGGHKLVFISFYILELKFWGMEVRCWACKVSLSVL